MNSQSMEYLRNLYHDGELSDSQRAEFERRLAEDPHLKEDFALESQWLDLMVDPPVDEKDRKVQEEAQAFVSTVMERWESEAERTGVLGHINWKSAFFSGGWVAAAILIALVMYVNQPEQKPDDGEQSSRFVHSPNQSSSRTRTAFAGHPLTAVVNDLTRDFEEHPQTVSRMIDGAQSWLDVDNLASQFGVTQAGYREDTR